MSTSEKKSLFFWWDWFMIVPVLVPVGFLLAGVFRGQIDRSVVLIGFLSTVPNIAVWFLVRLPPVTRLLGTELSFYPIKAFRGMAVADRQKADRRYWKKVLWFGSPVWLCLFIFLCRYSKILILGWGGVFFPSLRPILMLFVVLFWFPIGIFVFWLTSIITAMMIRLRRIGAARE